MKHKMKSDKIKKTFNHNVRSTSNRLLFLGFFIGLVSGFILQYFVVLFHDFSKIIPFLIPPTETDLGNKTYYYAEDEDENRLNKTKNKVLCWVPIFRNDDPQIHIIRSSYGKHCDQLVFISRDENKQLDVIAHNYSRVNNMDLWNQVHRGWTIVSNLFLEDFEWFMKLDQDSFFIPENLISLVHDKRWNSQMFIYYGHTIFEQSRPVHLARSQFNLGAGYGVSRGLLRAISPYFSNNELSTLPPQKRCPDWVRWGEDVKFADCLRVAFPQFIPNITRDNWYRENFVPFEPSYHLAMNYGDMVSWFWRGKDRYKVASGIKSLSSRPCLFHHLKEKKWFMALNYLIYNVHIDPRPRPL